MTLFKRILAYKYLYSVSFLVLILDQASKYWVVQNIRPGTYHGTSPTPVIDGVLYWVHIHNTGAAWGRLSGGSFWLGLLAIIVIGLIYLFRRKLELDQKPTQYAFGLLTGGIVGNLIDRFAYGYVIDFIDFHIGSFYRWPAFNIADIGICLGVGLYVLLSFQMKKAQK